jgi:hypothetical protein
MNNGPAFHDRATQSQMSTKASQRTENGTLEASSLRHAKP